MRRILWLGIVVLVGGCKIETGGDEGWVCNPLVLQDECNTGLHCTPASCGGTAYCCPVSGKSSDPNCNQPGCVDGGDDGGGDAAPE